jgi:hypothetical protein
MNKYSMKEKADDKKIGPDYFLGFGYCHNGKYVSWLFRQ